MIFLTHNDFTKEISTYLFNSSISIRRLEYLLEIRKIVKIQLIFQTKTINVLDFQKLFSWLSIIGKKVSTEVCLTCQHLPDD